MWLVNSSWCHHCCSVHQCHWVSDRCWRDFALWWFFVRKKLSSQYWQFFFLFGLYYQTFLEFSQIERQSCLFGLIMPCLLVNGTWECLIVVFSFFCGIMFFLCVYQWCGFSRYKFFHFWSQSLADIIILMCSFWFIKSILLGYWSLH